MSCDKTIFESSEFQEAYVDLMALLRAEYPYLDLETPFTWVFLEHDPRQPRSSCSIMTSVYPRRYMERVTDSPVWAILNLRLQAMIGVRYSIMILTPQFCKINNEDWKGFDRVKTT